MAKKPNRPKTIYHLDPECMVSLRVGQVNLLNELIGRNAAMDLEPYSTEDFGKCPTCARLIVMTTVENFCPQCGQRLTGKIRDYEPFEKMED